MPHPSPAQTLRFQEKRESLLAAAALLFNQRGVKGATLSDIAASVGLVTNSVTYYYRKKEDLAAACFLRAIARFDALAQAAVSQPTVAGRVRDFLLRHAELMADVQRGTHWPVAVLSDVRALPSPQLETVHTAYTAQFRRVRALFKGGETTDWSRETLNARTHMLLALVHWMPVWFGRYEVQDYRRVAERVADIALNGLHAASTPWLRDADRLAWRSVAEQGAPEAFLRAATALVNEQGYRGASVEKISARLHVTKGSFYHHHDNKLDLISACFDRTFAVLRQAIDAAEAGGDSGWQRVCSMVRALTRFQLSAEGPLLRLSSSSALPAPQDRSRVLETMQRLTESVGNMLVDGLVDGSIRRLDPAVAAQLVIGSINGTAELHRWVPDIAEATVEELYARPLLLGLLCPA